MLCCSNEGSHSDGACSMLEFFTPGDANYKKAVKIIMANSKNYSINSLFELAKLLSNNSPKAAKGGSMSAETFEVKP